MAWPPSKPGMTQQTRAGEESPSFPTPNTSFILWCQAPDYPHAGPVNSSPYKRVRSKVYCNAVITPSSLADLCADHRMNSNWLWSPAWGHSEILHSLAGSLQSHSVCEGIWEFPSPLPPALPPSCLSFLPLLIRPPSFSYSFMFVCSLIHEFIYLFIRGFRYCYYIHLPSVFIHADIHWSTHSLNQTRSCKGH